MVGLAVVFVFSFVAGGEEEGGSEEESLFRAPIVGGVVKGCFFCFAGCTSTCTKTFMGDCYGEIFFSV